MSSLYYNLFRVSPSSHPRCSGPAVRVLGGGFLGLIVLATVGCEQAPPKPTQEHFLMGGAGRIAFTPDGKRLLTGSQSNPGNVKVWDTDTWRLLSDLTGPEVSYPLSNGEITQIRLSIGEFVLSPKGELAASIMMDPKVLPTLKNPQPVAGLLLLWDSATGKVIHSLDVWTGFTPIAFSPDGKLLALTDEWKTVKVIDVQTGKVVPSPKFPSPTPVEVCALAFSPDGKRLACLNFISEGRHHVISVWDLASGSQVWEWGDATVRGRIIAFSPDGSLVATLGAGGTFHVRDANNGEHGYSLTGYEGLVHKIAFHPNGRYLASSGSDSKVLIWDLKTKKVIHRLEASPHPANHLVFSPDGKWLAGACGGDAAGGVVVWNLQPTIGKK